MLDDATASFAASPARCNSSTRAAFIIAGHARTFILKDVRHSLLVNAIRAFEARAFTFFLISGDDHGSNKGHRPVVSDETAVREAASEFRPTVFRYDSGERELPQLPATCVLNGTKSGDYWRSGQSWWVQWWQTWDRLRRAFNMVVEYEEAHGFAFEWVVRIRPDAWFFDTGPAHCELTPSAGIVTPAGVAACVSPCMNDHLAWVPRAFAAHYFFDATAELQRCNGTSLASAMRDFGYFLFRRLVHKVPIAIATPVAYTLVRPCRNFSADGQAAPECSRVLSSAIAAGHPGMRWWRVANASGWREQQYDSCRARWASWPNGTLPRRRGSIPNLAAVPPPRFARFGKPVC